jgi:flavin-dependent dehydrogenase
MGANAAYDVVVLGGGVAGCATALALLGVAEPPGEASVLIVEAAASGVPRAGESIPPDARAIFERLGLWAAFCREKHEPCLGSCSVWGEREPGYNDFLRHPLGSGWHLDRARFERFLVHEASARGAELLSGTSFRTAAPLAGGGYVLGLASSSGERRVHARFVVDATGRRAHFARSRGVRRLLHDQLLSSACYFELPAAAPFSALTLLEAVEYGWWYAARLPDGRSTAAVAVEPRMLRALGLHERGSFLDRLRATSHLGRCFDDRAALPESPSLCVAASSLLSAPAGRDWLAVGDAAASYDPLSSLGIYKALSDGLRAAPVITAALAGDAVAHHAYVRTVALKFSEYLFHRQRFYAAETRWSEAEFWRERRARTRLVAEAGPVFGNRPARALAL